MEDDWGKPYDLGNLHLAMIHLVDGWATPKYIWFRQSGRWFPMGKIFQSTRNGSEWYRSKWFWHMEVSWVIGIPPVILHIVGFSLPQTVHFGPPWLRKPGNLHICKGGTMTSHFRLSTFDFRKDYGNKTPCHFYQAPMTGNGKFDAVTYENADNWGMV